MQLKLFTDTHIAKAIAIQLRLNGIDVQRLEETPDLPNNAEDNDILTYANEQGRAVLSLDDDFSKLHSKCLKNDEQHCGVFLGGRHLQGSAGIGVIVKAVTVYHELIVAGAGTMDDLAKQLIYIN
jgi:predicted nuclease of predicted toxin-antitoxin system